MSGEWGTESAFSMLVSTEPELSYFDGELGADEDASWRLS